MNEPMAFAELLKLLFLHCTREDGTPYKPADVARATGVTRSQLSLLLNGQRSGASVELARTLIGFFEVSLDVLNATSEQEVLEFVALRKKKAEPTLRIRGRLVEELSPRALQQMEQLIAYVLERDHAEREGLPVPPTPFTPDE